MGYINGDGLRVHELRTLAGMTRQQMSDIYGIPYETLKGWENGRGHCPPWALALLERVIKEDMKRRS